MLRSAVPAGNTEYKHMAVSIGRTQTRNQIDGMDRWTAGWICRWIDGNGSGGFMDGWMGDSFSFGHLLPPDGRLGAT